VCISTEVLKDSLGATERRFAIDDPLLFIELFPEGIEGAWFLEMTDTGWECKITPLETMFEMVKKLASEQRRHHPYGKEESFAAGYPAASIRRKSTPRDNTVNVRMIHKILSPGMQNTNDAYFCAEMFRVMGEFHQRLGNGAEKKIVHDLPVHRYQGIQFRGNCEDHMKILNGQKVLTASLDPLFLGQGLAFGTMPVPAGVIRYLQMSAVVALVLMTAQGSGSAELDGVHDPQMIAGQPMGFSICRSVLTENVRRLNAVRCSHPLSGLRSLVGCSIEGRNDLGQIQPADMQIDGGRRRGSVAKKQLNMVEACSRFNEVGRYFFQYCRKSSRVVWDKME